MPTCCSDLESTLYILLTPDIRKIHILLICFTCKNLIQVNFYRIEFSAAIKKVNYITKALHPIYIQISNNSRFPRIFQWYDNSFKPFFPGPQSYWQDTFDGLECSVKRQLTHQNK